jgi:hypothetical protein
MANQNDEKFLELWEQWQEQSDKGQVLSGLATFLKLS